MVGRVNAIDVMNALVIEDGRRWGDAAARFQAQDARAILDERAEPFHFLTRARGASKTGDLGGVAVAAMLTQAPAGARLYGLAADRDQGRLLLDSIRGYVERTPELRGRLIVDSFKVTAGRDVVLEVLAADAASSWGLRPWFVIVDEIAQWASTGGPRTLWESVASSAAKSSACRMVLLTSAGDPAHWAHGVLAHAKADPLWRVHEVRGPSPWMDKARLAEQKRRLPESSYLRLFENQWTASEDRVASLDDIRACVTLDGPLEPERKVDYVIGVDLGLKRDRTVAAVCHGVRASEGFAPTVGARVVLDRMQVWQGSRLRPVKLDDVEDWIAETAQRYNRALVVLDPWQSAGLQQRLVRRGVWAEEFVFSAQSVGRLAVTVMSLIRNHQLALPDDEELISELANLRLRETAPGVMRLDHDPGRHDDRAVALALAAHKLAPVAWDPPKRPEKSLRELLLEPIPDEAEQRRELLQKHLEKANKPARRRRAYLTD